jgi:hypothetical protein
MHGLSVIAYLMRPSHLLIGPLGTAVRAPLVILGLADVPAPSREGLLSALHLTAGDRHLVMPQATGIRWHARLPPNIIRSHCARRTALTGALSHWSRIARWQ